MPEPVDGVVPILQKIQASIADLKQDLGGRIDLLGSRVDGLTEGVDGLTSRIDRLETYFTFSMGLTQQNKLDIQRVRADFDALKKRLQHPEGTS